MIEWIFVCTKCTCLIVCYWCIVVNVWLYGINFVTMHCLAWFLNEVHYSVIMMHCCWCIISTAFPIWNVDGSVIAVSDWIGCVLANMYCHRLLCMLCVIVELFWWMPYNEHDWGMQCGCCAMNLLGVGKLFITGL